MRGVWKSALMAIGVLSAMMGGGYMKLRWCVVNLAILYKVL